VSTKKKSSPELLTIQKFIFLLDDFHFAEFAGYLKTINATLPLKLTAVIREALPEFDTHEVLCQKIYGVPDKSQKQNFNQLSSYTFKLSAYLALNYPAYLHPKLTDIQRLVNQGNYRDANFLAETLEDFAERVEDFQVQIGVLKFLSQQAFLVKDLVLCMRLNRKLETVLHNEIRYIKVQTELRQDAIREKPLTEKEFADRKNYYRSYLDEPSHRIKIIACYAYLCCMVQNDARFFTKSEDLEILAVLEKEMRNHAYLIFPFMSDIEGQVGFLKLNSILYDPVAKETMEFYATLSAHYDSIKFWRSYLNMGALFLITVTATRLLTTYHCYIHRPDYEKILTPEDNQALQDLLDKCDKLIAKDYYEKKFEFGVRHLTMVHAALLIISGGNNIKKGIDELESLLIAYQQVNLKSSTDSIYLCLMVGYFSIKDYEKCVQTFKRYSKNSKGKSLFQPNDTKIYSYYYIAQWLLSHSKQYPAKLEAMLRRVSAAIQDEPPPTIMELIRYYKVPVSL
jgi:hypothetical protein